MTNPTPEADDAEERQAAQAADPFDVMGNNDGRTWEERQADLDAFAEAEMWALEC